jgi:hypothetical protein
MKPKDEGAVPTIFTRKRAARAKFGVKVKVTQNPLVWHRYRVARVPTHHIPNIRRLLRLRRDFVRFLRDVFIGSIRRW